MSLSNNTFPIAEEAEANPSVVSETDTTVANVSHSSTTVVKKVTKFQPKNPEDLWFTNLESPLFKFGTPKVTFTYLASFMDLMSQHTLVQSCQRTHSLFQPLLSAQSQTHWQYWIRRVIANNREELKSAFERLKANDPNKKITHWDLQMEVGRPRNQALARLLEETSWEKNGWSFC